MVSGLGPSHHGHHYRHHDWASDGSGKPGRGGWGGGCGGAQTSHLGLVSQDPTKPPTQEAALLLTVWATRAMGRGGALCLVLKDAS